MLYKKAIVIFQWSWKGIQKAQALMHWVRFFSQNKDIGTALHTFITNRG